MENFTAPAGVSSRDVVIGSIFIVEAVIAISLHSLVSYLIYTDDEMNNATYALMINLSIADCVELVMIGVYAGVVLLTRWHNDTVSRLASFLVLTAWFTTGALFVVISFSRWVAITRPHLNSVLLRKNIVRSLHVAVWLVPGLACFYFCVLAQPGPVLPFMPHYYTWSFDTGDGGQRFALANVIINGMFTVIETSFNIFSLAWVHKTRKHVQNLATSENKRREVMLLFQCAILGFIYAAAYIFYNVVAELNLFSQAACISVQATWTFHHTVNPIVYFTVNKRLRVRAVKLVRK